ncbi:uncharacterized protein LOC125586176 [Brassica napus]|uniref:uncharacterized protein LOC125586176 n=1 Tax=Brassica napus TaxID=3708 RepID=UPI0006AB36AF|nr:uncharacterized protein LOC125586176 [Brassica napus]
METLPCFGMTIGQSWVRYTFSTVPRVHVLFGSLSATVSQVVDNGHWNLPPARSELDVTLQIILSTTSVPSAANGGDAYLVTWERIRLPSPLVQWHSVAWFKEKIPRCSFIAWMAFLGRYLVSPPASLTELVLICQQLPGLHASRAVTVLKLLNQVIIYNVWRERNSRIFTGVSSIEDAFFRVVNQAMRDRLLSLIRPSSSAPPPFLLEFYFWFIFPFN